MSVSLKQNCYVRKFLIFYEVNLSLLVYLGIGDMIFGGGQLLCEEEFIQ